MTNPAFAIYDAFKSAGVADDKARSAADSITEAANQAPLKLQLTTIEGDIKQLRWMVGFNTAMVLLVLGLLLRDTLSG
ncbi:hypothetical protein [Inquilinus sp. CAU 1745]|uniref:hypothetical protein n=1 Tax=Inquilinus sp. CAU 1745 TaxID=3140369 RepID=UPI00325B143E